MKNGSKQRKKIQSRKKNKIKKKCENVFLMLLL